MTGNVTRGSGYLEKFLAKKRLQIANKLIPPELREGKILDVGCGSYPYFLINTVFEDKYGLDPSVSSDVGNIKIKKLNAVGTKLPYKDNFFDVVTMLAVFEHIERDKLVGVVKEIRRVLKPGGRFILTTPCVWTDKLLRVMALFNLVSQEEMKEHTGGFAGKQLAGYFSAAGFNRAKIRTGHFEFWLNNWAVASK